MTKLAQQNNVLAGLLLSSVGQFDIHKEKINLTPTSHYVSHTQNTGQSNKKD